MTAEAAHTVARAGTNSPGTFCTLRALSQPGSLVACPPATFVVDSARVLAAYLVRTATACLAVRWGRADLVDGMPWNYRPPLVTAEPGSASRLWARAAGPQRFCTLAEATRKIGSQNYCLVSVTPSN